ncbi:pilus assembly protein PilM [Evansella sp. AB-P1]|uniref:type IV pilus biogenesis protein PilM n=1 Tax=Evansella sp. AB-P1 TaxID=3037653 RepID=UPI00241E19A2|nr:pilus assembly protein PilM [Evansella sp. AB-P1]MDG5786859.1 pilus assembly protein PilM [Evansella sp. AB-P1]
MFTLKRKHMKGLQIKDHVIRYVGTKDPSLSTIESFGEKYLPKGVIEKGKIVDEPMFDSILEECVLRWGLKNKEVLFFVPDSSVFFRKISISSDLPIEEIRGYLNFEIGSTIHLPFDDAYFDFYVLNEEEENSTGKRDILFFAAPEQLVKLYSQKLEEFKLKPIVADISPLSFYRLFTHVSEAEEKEHYLFIEWDLTSINLSIFHEDKPVFMRHLPYGMDEEDWNIRMDEGMAMLVCRNDTKVEGEINDQLLEIERVMNFYKYTMNQGEQEITNIILAGDHPKIKLIRNKISENSIPFKAFNEVNLGVHYHFYLPLSLCLKEV